jgi:hypothetical protein
MIEYISTKAKGGTFKFDGIFAVPDKLGTETDKLLHERLKKDHK